MVYVKYSNYMNWYNMPFFEKICLKNLAEKYKNVERTIREYNTSIVFKNSSKNTETFFL